MRRLVFLLLSLLVVSEPATAQTAEERARLDWAQQRGRLLFDIDRAAWVTTDDLRQRVPDLAATGIRGWTVERDGAGYNVIYYSGEGEARVAAYRARVENNRVVAAELVPVGSRPPLTPLQRRLANAREIVARNGLQDLRRCARSSLNLAIIPPDSPNGSIDVYVLTPQEQANVFPFGGHHRLTIAATGEIVSRRSFTNTCINMPIRDESGRQPVALSITHLLDQIPTEIHVFMAIWTGLPLGVSTTEPFRVWWVGNDGIRLIEGTSGRP